MQTKLEITYLPIDKIVPYPNNPRKNDDAVEIVAQSIKKFGWRVPILLGNNNVVIAGHTRLEAAKKLGQTIVPVLFANDLSESDQKAFRIMENRSADIAQWDVEKLVLEKEELEVLDPSFELSFIGFNDDSFMELTGDSFFKIDDSGLGHSIETEEANKGTRHQNYIIRFGKHEVFSTKEEFSQFEKVFDSYLAANGNDLGFINWLIDGRAS